MSTVIPPQRQPGPHDGAAGVGGQHRARPAELRGPFAHRQRPHPGDDVGRDPATVVDDLHHQEAGPTGQPDAGGAGGGVPHHVRQGLGRDPVRGHLHRGGQGRPLALLDHGHGQTGRGRAARQLAQRTRRAELVERGWSQVVHQAAHVRQHRGDINGRRLQHPVRGHRIGPGQVPGGLDPQGDRPERGTETVVQVATQPAALLLAGGHQRRPVQLQAGRELVGPGRRRGLPDQVPEQPLVAVGQRGTGRAQVDPADPRAAPGHR
ncbi:hypothetical protein WY02_11940 [Pseudonocardia sp. AL041005-10]|nr:hypothetical protein WY02_11940 [Pseudonocardia sp. AL041005-10]